MRSGGLISALVVLVLVLPSVPNLGRPPGASSGAGSVPLAGGGQGLVLSADPTDGYAPLLVSFRATPPNGSAPVWSWTFGDGGYYNGSGPTFDHPTHAYTLAGYYVARVVASYPTGDLNATVGITVRPTTVHAAISADPVNGTTPLTVFFNGSASGGSGTYTSFLWSFGDGGNGSGPSVQYTYLRAGRFQVNLSVTDSSGAGARASLNLSVATPPSPRPNSTQKTPGLPDPLGWLNRVVLAATLGVGVAVLLAVGAWVALSRRRDRSDDPTLEVPVERGTNLSPDGAIPVPPARDDPTAPPPTGGPRSNSLAGRRQLTYRILEELGRLPRLAPGEVATRDWTQAGISDRLGVGQSGVSKILRRLVDAGVLTSSTEHVLGSERRLRVYRLTPRGEQLAHALRPDRHDVEADFR